MALSIAGTRSSPNWRSLPGNFDRLNARALYKSSNELGIPDLPAIQTVPAKLVSYNSRYSIENAQPGDAVHFFLDDYRFETVWSQPYRSLIRLAKVGMALTPDFSLWTEMPLAMQQWQVYRSRWCGMWMHASGIPAIPTISWSSPVSWNFCFLGVPRKSVVAISTVGVTDESYPLFEAGFLQMMDVLEPSRVLVYGRMVPILGQSGADTKFYPHRWRQ